MKTNNDFREVDQQASKEFAVEEWSETCQTCQGAGTIVRMGKAEVGGLYSAETCPECAGAGGINYEKQS